MQATLRLNSRIWIKDEPKRVVNKLLTEGADDLETELKANIDRSTPAGRIYRRAPITAARRAGTPFRRTKGTFTRETVGYRIHRASAWGQPPARDTNKLYRSLRVRRVSQIGIRATVNAPGVKYLDDENYLNRPFFKSVNTRFYKDDFIPKAKARLREMKSSR
jgi:hypothetical protein